MDLISKDCVGGQQKNRKHFMTQVLQVSPLNLPVVQAPRQSSKLGSPVAAAGIFKQLVDGPGCEKTNITLKLLGIL